MDLNKTPVEALELQAAIGEWWQVQNHLNDVKARELELRKRVFAEAFPSPTEGSAHNKMPLAEGWILQGDYKINRKVDEAAAAALRASGDNVRALVDSVVRVKLEVNGAAWKALGEEDKRLLGELVVETPGTPSLDVKLPKR